MSLYALPKAAAGADRLVCPRTNTVIGPLPVTGWSYSWSPSTLLSSSTASRPTVTNVPVGYLQDYVLTVTTAQGCEKRDTIRITARDITPLMAATNAGADKTVCSGVSTTLGTSSFAGMTYTWSPFSALNNRFLSMPTHLFNSTSSTSATGTNYIMLVRDANNCVWRDTAKVTTNPLPAAIRVNAGTDQTIVQGGSVAIGGANPISGLTYAWTPSTGLNSATIAKPTANPTTTTEYIITVSNTFGCSRADTMLLTVIPIKEGVPVSGLTVSAYPNPATEVLHLVSNRVITSEVKLHIYDEIGREVDARSFSLNDAILNEELNVSKLAKGVYTVRVNTSEGELVFKVVKE